MFEEEKNKNSLLGHEIANIYSAGTNKSRIDKWMNKVHSVNGFHLICALSQIFLGLSVVALSLMNSIQPLWLATMMSVIGSVTSMLGVYFMYSIIFYAGTFDSLLHKSIKRVINAQN